MDFEAFTLLLIDAVILPLYSLVSVHARGGMRSQLQNYNRVLDYEEERDKSLGI
jgi:hypothetical protein